MLANVGPAKNPVFGGDVVGGESDTVAGGDFKRESLAFKIGVDVPVLAPVPSHGKPPGH